MEKENTEKKVLKWYQNFCKKHSIDPQVFDILAEMDRGVSAEENISIIEPRLRTLTKPQLLLTHADYINMKQRESERLKKEAKAVMDNFKKQKDKIILSKKTELLKEYLKFVVSGKCPGLFVEGRTGIGKTVTIQNSLKEMGADYEYMSGFTTPLALYQFLYNHRDKLVVLDDLEGLFRDNKAIAILKAAIGDVNRSRVVSYNTTSKAALDYPSSFEMKGNVIILCNEYSGKRYTENFEALLSRAIEYPMIVSHNEILETCHKILEQKSLSQAEKERVLQIIRDNVTEASKFNLRDFDKLVKFVQYNSDKAEDLFLSTMDFNETRHLVANLLNSDLPPRKRKLIFMEQTGLSARSYFRRRTELLNLMGKSAKVPQKRKDGTMALDWDSQDTI